MKTQKEGKKKSSFTEQCLFKEDINSILQNITKALSNDDMYDVHHYNQNIKVVN